MMSESPKMADELERDKQLTEGAIKVRQAKASASVTNEARVYEKNNGNSYLQDLVRVQANMDDGRSMQRLQRHAVDVATSPEYRALNRTDGTGGYFVPPVWLMSQFIELARAGRAYANVVTSQALPPGTDSINIPKVNTGTAVAAQTADNAAVSSVDLTDTSVSAPVRTIAGQQDVAIQLLDQSPINFDQVIFRDMTADYATKLDLQVISGSGSSGQVTGVRATSGITTIVATSGASNVKLVYAKVADGIQRVQTSRFLPPQVIVMHPRRWAWFLAAFDTSGRPLVVPNSGNPQNSLAEFGSVTSQEIVGSLQGLPVVTDPSLPTTLGAGTNEDVIHVLRSTDLLLWESPIRTRVLLDAASTNLSVRLQIYGYMAFSAARYPQSVVEIGGSALAAPVFDGSGA